jgi:hypothetical protein
VTQVFLYSWIYARETGNDRITPCIYFARSLFGKFDPYVYQRVGAREKARVDSVAPYLGEFENRLRECADKIFDKDIPFTQTDNTDTCANCSFRGICGR